MVACPLCGQLCKQRGVKIHIAKSVNPDHAEFHRQTLVDRYGSDVASTSERENFNKLPNQSNNQINQQMQNEAKKYEELFRQLCNDNVCNKDFQDCIANYINFLKECNTKLPGPKHPAIKFYQARKKKSTFTSNDRTYNAPTNPQHASKRDRGRRKQKYNYETMQWLYYNQRKKCCRQLLNTEKIC